MEGTTGTLTIDVHTELSHVQSVRLKRRLKTVLSVEEELPYFGPVGRQIGVHHIIRHRHANIHMTQVRLGHIQHDGSCHQAHRLFRGLMG